MADNLKQIRINKDVCNRLDKRKAKGDSYTDVIKSLLVENARLTARVEELESDKENMTAMSKALAVQIAINNPDVYNGIKLDEMTKMYAEEAEDEDIKRAALKTVADLDTEQRNM